MNQVKLHIKSIFTGAFICGIMLCLILATAVEAAFFLVDDSVPDGMTGSFRDVVNTANLNAEEDIVVLKYGHYILTEGQIVIEDDLTILGDYGKKPKIDGNRNDRVFYINPDVKVKIVDVTIINGRVEMPSGPHSAQGGGIFNNGDLIIKNCKISKNSVFSHYVSVGGAIYNIGALTIFKSNISLNESGTTGFGSYGGAIYNWDGVVNIFDSTINKNAAGLFGYGSKDEPCGGGGVFNSFGGKMCIINSIIKQNTAVDRNGGFGGGIVNRAELSIINSKILDNTAGSIESRQPGTSGGGFRGGWGGGIAGGRGLTIIGSEIIKNKTTFSGEGTPIYGFGGGIQTVGGTIYYSIITENKTDIAGGGIYSANMYGDEVYPVTLIETTVNNNCPDDCVGCE